MRYTPTLYQETLALVRKAQSGGDAAIAIGALAGIGFQKANPTDPKFFEAYICGDGYNAVFLQYRYYDTSSPFSIQPDKNVFLVKHLGQDTVVDSEEIRFLDN
ncbi:MAG: hypothetical protein ABJM82_01055 [Shimia thalassica]|uniref:hypothetical protein n=1 Tax=Rhodobacterales TaxID=204455 RepID=UPI0032980D98